MSYSSESLPLVTFFVACFNQARFVEDALESLRAQTFKDYELIIWDDASQDGSPAIIEKWLRDNGVRHHFIRNETNLGVCKCLNLVLGRARGQFIAGLAADDLMMPERLEQQVSFFRGQPECVGLVYSDAYTMNEDGSLRPESMLEWCKAEHPTPPEGRVFADLLRYNFVPAPTAMYRSSVFARVGLYDDSLPYEDFDMLLRIAREFEFRYLPERLVKYRVTSGALNTKQDKIQPAKFGILKRWFDRQDLSAKERGVTIHAMAKTALKMYRLGLNEAPVALAEAGILKNEQRLRWAAKAARVGVPFEAFSSAYRQLSRLKSLMSRKA
jgi:glycosyltransferase involved in cell wall biosynthesis